MNMTLERFKTVYADYLNTEEMIAYVPRYENREYCEKVAEKMTQAVIKNVTESKFPCDYLKHNPAMRRAANFFGIKTSPIFREVIKRLAKQA
ncbi:MAG: hypothetical protein ABSA17_09230 [Rhabdochlamydiaceae bacterium]